MEVKPEYRAIFCEEAADQLKEWEESLLALEKDPSDAGQINRMFRAIHTMKGSAGFIGFDELARLTHDLESSLQQVREGTRSFDSTSASFLFEGLDLCRAMIDAFSHDMDVERAPSLPRYPVGLGGAKGRSSGKDAGVDTKDFLDRLAAMRPAGQSPAPVSPGVRADSSPQERAPVPAPDGCRLAIRIDGSPHEAYLRSFLVRSRLERLGTILAVDPDPESLKDSTGPFVYTVTMKTDAPPETLPAAVILDLVTVTLAPPAGPAGAETASSARPQTARSSSLGEVVRVSVSKLDTLLNLVGELVIHNSGFVAITQQLRDQYGKTPFIYDLEQKTEALSVITRDLQEGIMKARMLPVANVFSRFSRVVRDLSKASGKTVTLEVFGEETEIDKKVIDRIGEPLVHLIRNAVDHGIESPAERAASGKAAAGRVKLGAYQDGDHICIEVSDDGRGLDRIAILNKALQKGLITPEEVPRASTERILGFIFLPGFSTAERVSDISGRGVGMDVVRSAVEEMSGSLRVRSTPRIGTTITITLPLTMAIISAVLVEVAGATFAIPLSSVREILKVRLEAVRSVGGRRVIMVREEVLAMVHLGNALKDGEDPKQEPVVAGMPVVVVDYEGRKIGLEVEEIIGTREIVIKSLSRHYHEIDGLIGASILGNGKIALIVDVETLVSQHYHGDGTNGRARMKGGVDFETLADQQISPEPVLETVSSLPPVVPAEPAASPLQVDEIAKKVINSQGTALEVVNNTSAIQASMSLSQFTGREVRVSFPESRLVPVSDVAEMMGGEEASVGGIYVEVKGDIQGGILLVLPLADLLEMDDLIQGRPPGTTTELAGVDLSAMCEMGNILAASFINTMADSTDLAVAAGVPEISVDMCLSVIDSVLAHFSQPGEEILITEAIIYRSGSENVMCHLLLFLEPDSLKKLLSTLEGEPSPRSAEQG